MSNDTPSGDVRMSLNQPFAGPVEKLRRDALSRPEYDPPQLFAWGQMMAVSLLEMLKAVEARFGREGQQVCTDALVEVGRRLALEGLKGVEAISRGIVEAHGGRIWTESQGRGSGRRATATGCLCCSPCHPRQGFAGHPSPTSPGRTGRDR